MRTLLDFYADWCHPCQQMKPIIEEIEAEFPGQVQQIDIEKDPTTAEKFGVMSIPTFIVEENGREIARIVGQASKEKLVEALRV